MLNRRDLLKFSGLQALSAALPSFAQDEPPDHRIEIAPVTAELSPRHLIKTIGYNGQVPGPLLRMREGRRVTIEVVNRTNRAEVVHWHGLFLPPETDGAVEEGTAPIPPSTTARYTFIPRPAGFRWYHTHSMAMGDLRLAQYGGQHGPLLVEPRNDAAGREVYWLSLAGHSFHVLALDGNAVPQPQSVSMLRLAPAERISALVDMNNPGKWVLGEVRKHVRLAGMGILVEYANQSGAPQWQQSATLDWNYERFAAATDLSDSSAAMAVPLVIESKFRGHGAMEAWTLNGEFYPNTHIEPLVAGRQYRLQLINKSLEDHPIHLHRHSFELRSLGATLRKGSASAGKATRGIIKDVVLVDAQTQSEVEFTADNPGAMLLHCHQQNHMDLGFMMLIRYA